MKYFDFISNPPSIYLLNQAKAKSKVGVFFFLIFYINDDWNIYLLFI